MRFRVLISAGSKRVGEASNTIQCIYLTTAIKSRNAGKGARMIGSW